MVELAASGPGYTKRSRIIPCGKRDEHERESKRGGESSNLAEPLLLKTCRLCLRLIEKTEP